MKSVVKSLDIAMIFLDMKTIQPFLIWVINRFYSDSHSDRIFLVCDKALFSVTFVLSVLVVDDIFMPNFVSLFPWVIRSASPLMQLPL